MIGLERRFLLMGEFRSNAKLASGYAGLVLSTLLFVYALYNTSNPPVQTRNVRDYHRNSSKIEEYLAPDALSQTDLDSLYTIVKRRGEILGREGLSEEEEHYQKEIVIYNAKCLLPLLAGAFIGLPSMRVVMTERFKRKMKKLGSS